MATKHNKTRGLGYRFARTRNASSSGGKKKRSRVFWVRDGVKVAEPK